MPSMQSRWSAWLAILLLAACDGATPMTADDAGPPDAGPPDAGPMWTPACTQATAPPCTDESILDLTLYTEPNTATIENTADGDGWQSHVDATGGGFSPSLSYVYARFTEDGLERVDVGDEAAFDSMDWDIAFRRFLIRLNSGPSGPSCVSGARTAPATDYDALDAPPDGIEYHVEQYYTDTCELVPDGSGLGSAGTVLQSFWEYPGCVKMTGNVYVLELASGRHVKLTVTSYYEPSYQEMCDSTGSVTMGSANGAGNIRIRWAFLD
jgi:hypothetical protein